MRPCAAAQGRILQNWRRLSAGHIETQQVGGGFGSNPDQIRPDFRRIPGGEGNAPQLRLPLYHHQIGLAAGKNMKFQGFPAGNGRRI